jgi:hypothetical protein
MNGGYATYLKDETDCWIDFHFFPASLQSAMIPMTKEDVKKEGWTAEELGEQSAYEGITEIGRRLRRGDETAGDPNARDVAGVIPEKDTPHGREARDRPHKSAEEKSDEEQVG